ncbi:hypothetical protein ALC60_06558 [Trachymyrmex zeteki]|uniref:Uncharacterized protein n=1 Tax=Mycetomoellerius zeteki TaxID=64791 RepID=A0A151X295_9HYME|nr:hypothetical protein ALC60_06558 [Trachymyrmex zeteki]
MVSHFRIKWLNVMSAIDYSHYDGKQLVSRARKLLDNTAAIQSRYNVRYKVSRAFQYMHNFTT